MNKYSINITNKTIPLEIKNESKKETNKWIENFERVAAAPENKIVFPSNLFNNFKKIFP